MFEGKTDDEIRAIYAASVPATTAGQMTNVMVADGRISVDSLRAQTDGLDIQAIALEEVRRQARVKMEEARQLALLTADREAAISNLSKATAIVTLLGRPPTVPIFLPGAPVDYRWFNKEVVAWKKKCYSDLNSLPEYNPVVPYQKGNLIKRGQQVYYLVLGPELSSVDYPGDIGGENWSEVASISDYAPEVPAPVQKPATNTSTSVAITTDEILSEVVAIAPSPITDVIFGEDTQTGILQPIGDPSLDLSPVLSGSELSEYQRLPEFIHKWKFPEILTIDTLDEHKVLYFRILAALVIGGLLSKARCALTRYN